MSTIFETVMMGVDSNVDSIVEEGIDGLLGIQHYLSHARSYISEDIANVADYTITQELFTQFIVRLKVLSQNDPIYLAVIDKLALQTIEVNKAYLLPSLLVSYYAPENFILSTKSIAEWQVEDIALWSAMVSAQGISEEALIEVLAVFKQAVKCSDGFLLQNVQIFSILSLLSSNKIQDVKHRSENKFDFVDVLTTFFYVLHGVSAHNNVLEFIQNNQDKVDVCNLFGISSTKIGVHLGKDKDASVLNSMLQCEKSKIKLPSDTDSNRSSPITSIGIGMIAGGLEAFLTHPLVTLKALSQNNTPLKIKDYWDIHKGINWSFWNTKDLASKLYRGVYTNVAGMSCIIATRMLVRDSILENFFDCKKPSIQQHMIAASCAGLISAMITTPMELGMTLQQTDKSIKKSNSFVSTYSSVIGKFGVRYGFTGLTCLALRDTLVTASLLTFPGMLKVNLRSYLDQNDVNISDKLLHTFSGGVVGALYAILTHPLDTIKTVQQVTLRSAVTKEECSILSVVKSIYNSKGMSGYYHGLAWRTARVTPHVAIISSITENLTSMLNKKWY